jgi:broad specificity phosphatase PhoE
VLDTGITECDYGEWQGKALKDLASEPLWSVVQSHPSAAIFPGGESMATMQARSVAAIRHHDAAFESQHGPGAVWVAVSHGDIIKSILADALGMHLDLFQRIRDASTRGHRHQYRFRRPLLASCRRPGRGRTGGRRRRQR